MNSSQSQCRELGGLSQRCLALLEQAQRHGTMYADLE